MADHHDDHDRGLAFDLETIARQQTGRRNALAWFASAGAAAFLSGCGGGGGGGSTASAGASTATATATPTPTPTPATTITTTTTTTSGDCTAFASETQGPYPSDGSNSANGSISNVLAATGIVRSDMRTSFGAASGTAAGVPVTLRIKLVNSRNGCAALAGYAIYLWHCDRDGRYSLYDLPTQNYLRAVGVADANGEVTFTTIYPGCYAGRFPHMHFEIFASQATATGYQNKLFTSQIAMPANISETVYANASGYGTSATNNARVSLASDGIFGDNSAAQNTAMTPVMGGSVADGFSALLTIAVSV